MTEIAAYAMIGFLIVDIVAKPFAIGKVRTTTTIALNILFEGLLLGLLIALVMR